MTAVLLMCTANVCRSVMAQALLSVRLGELAPTVSVQSGGTIVAGESPPSEVVSAVNALGADVADHHSCVANAPELLNADLVIGMAREHVRHAVVMAPNVWSRAFTLKELVRRGQDVGPRMPNESLASWLGRVHEGRQHRTLLGQSSIDDVADPMGGPPEAYVATAELIDQLVSRLVDLCWGYRLPAW